MTITEAVEERPVRRRTDPPPIGDRLRRAARRGTRWYGPAIAVYLGIRFLSVLTWIPLAHRQDVDPFDALHGWDGLGYLDLAHHGYGPIVVSSDGNSYNSAAFFPLYPHLMRWTADLTGLDPTWVGLTITWAASLVAVAGIFELGLRTKDRRTALILVALYGIAPSAMWQWTLYADGLFIALAVWTLLAVMDRRWLTAGVLCVVAGLTRPTAVSLIGAVGLAALVSILRREDGWRPWVGAAIAPLGVLSYLGWLWYFFGRWDAYFVVQEGWGAKFDWGVATFQFVKTELVAGAGENIVDFTPAFMMTMLSLVGACLLMAVLFLNARKDRLPLVILAYTAAGLFLTIGNSQLITSKPRELLAFFPLLLPAAGFMADARTRSLIFCLAALGLAAGWYAWYVPALASPWPP